MTEIHFAALVLRDITRQNALLLKRNLLKPDGSEKFLGGKFTGIGGGVEPDETPEQCIRREVPEEFPEVDLNIVTDIRHHLVLHDTISFPKHHVMHWFTGITTQSLIGIANPKEGELHWYRNTDLPLPLGQMTPPAHAAIPFILGLAQGDASLYTANFGYRGNQPVLDFI